MKAPQTGNDERDARQGREITEGRFPATDTRRVSFSVTPPAATSKWREKAAHGYVGDEHADFLLLIGRCSLSQGAENLT